MKKGSHPVSETTKDRRAAIGFASVELIGDLGKSRFRGEAASAKWEWADEVGAQ